MTKNEIQLLKRFTAVTPSFVLKNDGITFLSPDKTMCGVYKPQEPLTDFESDTPLSNVGEFLSIVGLFGDGTTIDTSNKVISIKNGKKEVKYLKTNADYVKEVPQEFIEVVEEETPIIEFNLEKEELQEILKVSSLLNAGDLRIQSKDSVLTIEVLDNSNPNNTYSIEIDGDFEEDIEVFIDIKMFSLLNGDSYTTKVLDKKVVFDSSSVKGLRYIIATTNV